MSRRTRRGRPLTSSGSSPRRNRRFDAIVAIGATLAIYFARIDPLSAPPAPPPSGLAIAWAGLPLRGYAESVYVTATSCSAPVSVHFDLFPPSAASVSLRPPGRVAFAFAGDLARAPLSSPRIYVEHAERPRVYRAVNASNWQGRGYVFSFVPSETPDISVDFSAHWTTPRTVGTCWLDIPAQISVNGAGLMANELLGHGSDWAREARGFPVYHADVYLQGNGASSQLPIEPIASLPAPGRIDPPEWSCENNSQTISTCETLPCSRTSAPKVHAPAKSPFGPSRPAFS